MKKDIRNDKGQQHGYWEVYWGETNDFGLIYRCFFQYDKLVGYSEWCSILDNRLFKKIYNI